MNRITVNRRRLVGLASDVTKYVIVHFLFWSCDQYRASMLKEHITNNNIIIILADSRAVFSQIISLSKLSATRSTQGNVMPGSSCVFYGCSTSRKYKLSLFRIPTVASSNSDHTKSLKQNAGAEWLRLILTQLRTRKNRRLSYTRGLTLTIFIFSSFILSKNVF